MRKINEIIVHCSATKQGKDYHAKDIDRWHRERGFKCIGYHYVVCLDGTVEKGREESEIGAHCTNHNRNSIGVCYIGGLDKQGKPKDTRTPAQRSALFDLLFLLKQNYPDATIHGHREFAKKDCPCFNAREEYRPISESWASIMGGIVRRDKENKQ